MASKFFITKLQEVKTFVEHNKTEVVILCLILLLGAFLRLYRIEEYLTFLGDEGRDALVVRRLLVDFDPIFVGPGTSVGNMYLGPFYYYLMAPFLLLFNFSPVGPAVMVALFGVATIYLVWQVTRGLFFKGETTAYGSLLAAFLYAVNPTVIKLTRFSWNPNIMPFFALLFVLALWRFAHNKNYKVLIWAALLFGLILQSHYMGAVLVLLAAIYYLASIIKASKAEKKVLAKYTLYAGLVFLTTTLPLIIFDAKHKFRNFLAMREFFADKDAAVSLSLANFFGYAKTAVEGVFRDLFGVEPVFEKLFWLTFVVFLIWVLFAFRNYSTPLKKPFIFITYWIVVGVIGLGLYRKEIYDHYYAFMFPAPFIFLGGVLDVERFRKNNFLYVAATLVFTLLLLNVALANHPFKNEPNRQLARTELIAQKMVDVANGEPFNFAVISNNNYEGAYQYFLEKNNANFVLIDPQRADETITHILFVVCEYEDRDKCQPTSNPKAQIAHFGWSKIETSYTFDSIILYKLVHNIQ